MLNIFHTKLNKILQEPDLPFISFWKLKSLYFICSHSFSFLVSLLVIRCHSLSFVITRCHTPSFFVIRCHSIYHSVICCHSLPFVVPLVCLFTDDREVLWVYLTVKFIKHMKYVKYILQSFNISKRKKGNKYLSLEENPWYSDILAVQNHPSPYIRACPNFQNPLPALHSDIFYGWPLKEMFLTLAVSQIYDNQLSWPYSLHI